MASLTADDKVLIRILRTKKPFNAYQMIVEFPSRKWKKWALYRLIKKIAATGLSNRTRGGERNRSAGAADNIARIEQLICSKEDNAWTSKSLREIERATGFPYSSFIVTRNPNLKVLYEGTLSALSRDVTKFGYAVSRSIRRAAERRIQSKHPAKRCHSI